MQYCLVLQHSQAALLFQHQNVFSDYFPISAKISSSVIGWWFAAAISKLYFSSPSSKVLENLFYVKTDRSELTVLLALLVCSPSVFLLFHWFCFVLFCFGWLVGLFVCLFVVFCFSWFIHWYFILTLLWFISSYSKLMQVSHLTLSGIYQLCFHSSSSKI